jgi:FMN-dependent oxidoreductase (nitrilotriacetate monooxygenase family)
MMSFRKPGDEMVLIGFMQAQNCSQYPASWRHPDAAQDFLTPQYFARIARTLEDAKFHMAFFDDRLAMPDMYGHDFRTTVEHGIRAVKMDPVVVGQVMGLATSRLGIGVSCSTTYYHPFHVARMFATLDLMLGGRTAWNIVTSLNDSEAANFGFESHPEHDSRYDRADEFMDVVLGHWASWEPDALTLDRESGRFADPDKVHALHHAGVHFKSKGPFPVPRSPQGHTVLMQAGQSGRGRGFAARWAELVFTIYANIAVGTPLYRSFKEIVAAAGRDPAQVKVTPCVQVVAGATQAMAEDRMAFIDKLAKPEDTLVLLSEILNYDFAARPVNVPFTDEELKSINGLQGMRDKVLKLSGIANPTTADFVKFGGRATIREFPMFVGTGKAIADQMEQWFNESCDGFVIAPNVVPGTYEDVARLVVPELQKRGLAQKDYRGITLRENLATGAAFASGVRKGAT